MPRANEMEVIEADEDVLRQTAAIMGKTSASARALEELKERQARGEDAAIYQQGSVLLVGPRIEDGCKDERAAE